MKIQENTPLETIFRLSLFQKKALSKMRLKTALDLLRHFPTRYGEAGDVKSIEYLNVGENAVVFGKISKLKTAKTFKSRVAISTAEIEDSTGKVKIIWFSQPYIAKMFFEGNLVRIEGRVSQKRTKIPSEVEGELYFSNPKIEKISEIPEGTSDSLFAGGENFSLTPIYPESRGISSNWLYHAIQKIFSSQMLDELQDPIPEEILKKYNLPSLKTSFIWIHAPRKKEDAEIARKRFAFEEIFFIQLDRQKEKYITQKEKSFLISKKDEEINDFIDTFPFPLTSAQKKSIDSILGDFKTGHPMSRLLEGDVGSGKTAVAATTAYTIVSTHPPISASDPRDSAATLQVAYMAPTEILAEQHFESFIEYFAKYKLAVGLITGSGAKKFPSKINKEKWTKISKPQLLKWVANGEIPILIGTHALIQKTVQFKNLALIIIDEQHRFGVSQRRALARGKTQNQTPTNAEKEKETLLYRDLSYIIRGAVFEVKKNIGLGHKEIIYQKALEEEFKARKILYSREKQIPILYRSKKVGVYQPDFVIDDKIIVELKALPFLGNTEKKQIWTYLKGSEHRLALLVNFGTTELQIERIVYDSARISASSPRQSASIPHLLSMTATPIPRTLALTIFGDLDLSLLDELPPGRQIPETKIVLPHEREEIYEKVRAELKTGRQVFVICPRVNDPDPDKENTINAKSVKSETERLQKKIFPEYKVGAITGKLKPAEKEKVMRDFKDKKMDILVATSVVEVGVNVPNATVIIIENAERFGLAQLHQLRGRVLRSSHKPYCFVFADTKSQKTISRLKSFVNSHNGFELAEADLQQRGSGDLIGAKQWGVSDLAMEALKNIKMVEAARTEARTLIAKDFELKKYPLLAHYLALKTAVHME